MTLNPIQKKWIYRALIMLIFIFTFSLRVHHLSEKKGFHLDEIYSFILSDYKDVGWGKSPPEGEYTGKELKDMIFKVDPSFKDAAKDIFLLWEDNRDTPHTNFYYSLLRISLIGLESNDYKDFQEQYIFRAGTLNLVLFSISFFSFLLLLNLLIKDKSLILLGLIVAFINNIDISHALFFRPYVLQGTFVIIFTAFLVWVSKKIEKNEYKETWQNMFIFALPLSLMLLTGYYSFVYAFFLGIFFVAFPLLRAKKLNLIAFFFAGSILAVFYDLVFYKNFLSGFYSYRTFEFAGNSSNDSFFHIDLIRKSLSTLKHSFPNEYAFICIIIIIAYKIKNKDSFNDLKKYLWIPLGAFVASVLIMLLAPYKTPRYICAYLPLIYLAYPLLLSGIKSVLFKRAFSAIIIALSFIFLLRSNIDHKYNTNDNDILSRIRNLDSTFIDENVLYTYGTGRLYSYINTINFHDDQKFIVCDFNNINSLNEKIKGIESYILFLERNGIELYLLRHNFEVFPKTLPHGVKVAKRKAN